MNIKNIKEEKKIFSDLFKFESRSMHGQLPIVWKKAKNYYIYDIHGKKIIDFTSTIFVSSVGHANANVIKSISKTLKNSLVHTYAYPHKLRSEYIKKLVKFFGKGFEKAFLMSSGTEVTEAALKLMRLNGQKIKKRKLGIIAFEGNWHGRTMGAQMMSGNIEQKKWIGYKDKHIYHLPFPYPWKVSNDNAELFFKRSINKLNKNINFKKDICGVMVETFQGWGAIFYPKNYIKELRKFCNKNNILLTFDEMQSGFSRTGKNFGYEHYDIKPDLVCCGKAMGGGLPISGVVGKKKILDLPSVGNMSSTNSANPISCAAGIAVLEEIKNKKLTKRSKELGKILELKLNKILNNYKEFIFWVNSKGLIGAIIFKKNIKNVNFFAKRITENCLQKGLLVVYTGRESIKFGPPLTISKLALKKGLDILEKSIEKEIKKYKNEK
jgi:4-aminobutyrate aminotransferase-like enzyme